MCCLNTGANALPPVRAILLMGAVANCAASHARLAPICALLEHPQRLTIFGHDLTVLQPCRKAGVGSELVKQVVADRGACDVWLVTAAYATGFYEQAGFEAVKPWQLPKCVHAVVHVGTLMTASSSFNVAASQAAHACHDQNSHHAQDDVSDIL